MSITRRDFLKGSASVLVSSLVSMPASARTVFKSDPFKLGVASGSPQPESVVLWTRLAPDPIHGGGLDPVPVEVKWEVASDETFHKIVKSGKAVAPPAYVHSLHVEVTGLKPSSSYYYRFFAGDAISPVGRTRTAPALDSLAPLSFSFASCQMYEQGYFTAQRFMSEEDLDLVVFLGDYIYEHSWGNNLVRKHESGEATTLDQYRNRYACYKTDADLQLCHTRFPWIVTWDDHEVSNDYASDRSEDLDPHFLDRRAAAYQAFYEHMPLPPSMAPHHGDMRIYRAYDFGRMARFHVLDDRQYRDYQVAPKPGRGGSNITADSPERHDPRRTMLGFEQEQWLDKSLKNSKANWDIVVQQTLMAQGRFPDGKFWTDGWDGYPEARKRLLESVSRNGAHHDTIVVGGDVHAWAIADLKLNFDDLKAPIVATELCGTSITSQGPAKKKTDFWMANNPHVHYGNGEARGYTTISLAKQKSAVALRSIKSEKTPDTTISTIGEYIVEKGKPGVQKA